MERPTPKLDSEVQPTSAISFLAEHSTVDAEAYTEKKIEEIVAGKPTWMRRNFDAALGSCFDYYKGGVPVGMVSIGEGVEAHVYDADTHELVAVYDGNSIDDATRLVQGHERPQTTASVPPPTYAEDVTGQIADYWK